MCKKRLKTKKALNCRLHVVIKMWNKYSFADFLCLGVLHLAGRKKREKKIIVVNFFLLGCVCYERTNCCSSLFVVYCPSNTITSVLFNFGIYIKLDFLTSQHWQKNSTSQTSSVFKNNIIISFVTSNYQPYAK